MGAYLIAVLAPQTVWWWNFDGLRPALWITLSTIIGLGFLFARKECDLDIVKNKRNLYIFVLWVFYSLSYYFGPYAGLVGIERFMEPVEVLSILNKMFFLYLLACICIDDERKLKYLVYALLGTGMYLIYWANSMYLSGRGYGRLEGPTDLFGHGIYRDGNNFAMLFVVVLPFLWYMGFAAKNVVVKWGLWLFIPFGWHAIFLTGSRGGLVGIAVTLLLIIWRAKSKMIALLLIPAFIFAFVWQAGDIMRERAATISEYETESSSAARLSTWNVALSMISAHPIIGVGLASFEEAFPDHSDLETRVAHNTILQITAESGIVAGLMYLFIIASCTIALWRNGKRLREKNRASAEDMLYWINESALVGFTGLIVCSLFLSLHLFEIFFLLCVIVNTLIYIGPEETAEYSQDEKPVSV